MALVTVTDGTTVNEPYWGNYGTTEANGYVELDLGAPKQIDNVKVWFVERPSEPAATPSRSATVQVQNGSGEWVAVPGAFKAPKIPGRSSTRRCSLR